MPDAPLQAAGLRQTLLGARAVVFVAAARLLLRSRPTSETLRLLAGRAKPRNAVGASAEVPRPDDALSAVRRCGGLLRAGCLEQSVALAALLQRDGGRPELVLGCRRYEGRAWGAHAWVELDGNRLEPAVEDDHAELARLSAEDGWEIRPARRPDGTET